MNISRFVLTTLGAGSLLFSACKHSEEVSQTEFVQKLSANLEISEEPLNVSVVVSCTNLSTYKALESSVFKFNYEVKNLDSADIICSDALYILSNKMTKNSAQPILSNEKLIKSQNEPDSGSISYESKNDEVVFVVSCYEAEDKFVLNNEGEKTIKSEKNYHSKTFHLVQEMKCIQ